MLRKLGIAGMVAGAALGSIIAASPAHANSYGGDQQYNQNVQGVAGTACNTNVAAAIAATVPILSPQTTGDCTNGPISANVD